MDINYITEEYDEAPFITDALGGIHCESKGWNPHGIYCGYCIKTSCSGCPRRKLTRNEERKEGEEFDYE